MFSIPETATLSASSTKTPGRMDIGANLVDEETMRRHRQRQIRAVLRKNKLRKKQNNWRFFPVPPLKIKQYVSRTPKKNYNVSKHNYS